MMLAWLTHPRPPSPRRAEHTKIPNTRQTNKKYTKNQSPGRGQPPEIIIARNGRYSLRLEPRPGSSPPPPEPPPAPCPLPISGVTPPELLVLRVRDATVYGWKSRPESPPTPCPLPVAPPPVLPFFAFFLGKWVNLVNPLRGDGCFCLVQPSWPSENRGGGA